MAQKRQPKKRPAKRKPRKAARRPPPRREARPEPAGVSALTPRQVAARLQVSERTVLDLLRSGEIPAIKIGRQWRVHPDVLDRCIFVGLYPMEVRAEWVDAPKQ